MKGKTIKCLFLDNSVGRPSSVPRLVNFCIRVRPKCWIETRNLSYNFYVSVAPNHHGALQRSRQHKFCSVYYFEIGSLFYCHFISSHLAPMLVFTDQDADMAFNICVDDDAWYRESFTWSSTRLWIHSFSKSMPYIFFWTCVPWNLYWLTGSLFSAE